MDPVLVAAASMRPGLANWLLDALERILDGSALPTFRGRLTAMAEFALAVAILADLDAPASDWGRSVVHRLAEACGETRIRQSLAADPTSASAHAWLVEALIARGLEPHLPLVRVLDALEAQAARPAIDLYPLARIQALYLHHRLGRSISPDSRSPASRPVFFRWPAQWQPLVWKEIYELTHAVFFLTDFGCNRWAPGLQSITPSQSTVTASLHRAAAFCIDTGQFDLVGEITLALLFLDKSADVGDSISAMEAARQSDGSIRGWPGSEGFAAVYHATLIGLLAASRIVALSISDGEASTVRTRCS